VSVSQRCTKILPTLLSQAKCDWGCGLLLANEAGALRAYGGTKLRRQDFYRAHNAAPASTDSQNNLGHLHGGSIPLTIHGDRVNAGP
jgi:hypothetical protein